jgi:hypothetical protein
MMGELASHVEESVLTQTEAMELMRVGEKTFMADYGDLAFKQGQQNLYSKAELLNRFHDLKNGVRRLS